MQRSDDSMNVARVTARPHPRSGRTVLAALVAFLLLGGVLPARAAAPAGRIVGSLVFRDRDRLATPAQAQRVVGGKRIALPLRSGGDVVTVQLDGNGRFAVDVAPGTWRLEWIDVGDRAEILATPLAFEARAGGSTCAGRIEVTFGDLATELGASAMGTARVAGGCEAGPGGGDAAGAPQWAPAPELYEPAFGFQEVAEGLRVGGFAVDEESAVRVSWAVPLRRPLAWMGNVLVVGGASRRFASDGDRDAFEAGAGFVPWWGAELTGGLSWEREGGGAAPWGALRLGPAPYAFFVRADFRDGAAWSFGLELSAFHVLGRFF